MRSAARHYLAASALVLTLTIFLTWPQAVHLTSTVASHHDSYFSMWRLAWVAHALGSGLPVYDANIYYPERGTLAYSDAVILQGAIGAPLIWLGMPVPLVYNLLLLLGIAGSGLAMFALARHLTGGTAPALVSAAVFTLLPYRIEHYMHLELQWTMWMPLAWFAAHRAVETRSWRLGALCGVLVWLQLLSSVYYGVFLAILIGILALLLIATEPSNRVTALTSLALGGVCAIVLALPYSRPYLTAARQLGPRDAGEVATFSARWASYMTAPYLNWAWGWTGDRFAGEELRLLPGLVTAALASIGALGYRNRITWIYVLVCAVAIELSLGVHGWLYPWFLQAAPPLGGFRAIARFAILAFCALAVLAGFGVRYLQERFASVRAREWVAAAAMILIVLESGSAPLPLMPVRTTTPDLLRVLAQLPPGVVAEFPMSEPNWIPRADPQYQYWSRVHWKPLVNGYSGYASREYLQTLESLKSFPDDRSIARLQSLDVRYIVVHHALYARTTEPLALVLNMLKRPELTPAGRYKDILGEATLFELKK